MVQEYLEPVSICLVYTINDQRPPNHDLVGDVIDILMVVMCDMVWSNSAFFGGMNNHSIVEWLLNLDVDSIAYIL